MDTNSNRPVVVCQGLTKVFKDFWMRDRARAVDQLTFEIRAHEVFGLLGPNGSGKSTTIKMILGLLHPTKGRVQVFGKLPTDVSIKRRIGYLPEESYLYPFLNARETLEYYAKIFEIERKDRHRRIDQLLEMVGLTSAQFRPVREYSKGMQRRIGLAQALINDPDFLILDEPTTGLDPIGTRQVKDLIVTLGKRGKTILLSSHLLADVEDCVDRLTILYGGKTRREGTCDDLLLSRERTTIETDALDEGTLAEVDRVVRERSAGRATVLKVTHPRQKLEDLFLDIVEEARVERLETSGAQHGGETAAFLAGGDDAPQGEALIESLVRDEGPEPAPPAPTPEPEPEVGHDVIDALTGGSSEGGPSEERSPEAGPTSSARASTPSVGHRDEPRRPIEPAAPIETEGVDEDIIGSLLENEDEEPKQ